MKVMLYRGYSDRGTKTTRGEGMPLDEKTLAELRRVEAATESQPEDRRSTICSCGHPIQKHVITTGRSRCNALVRTCPCATQVYTLRAPNARCFTFKSDDEGHAVMKGMRKTITLGMGEKLDWHESVKCVDCDQPPVTVVAVEGGKTNEPRCEVHR